MLSSQRLLDSTATRLGSRWLTAVAILLSVGWITDSSNVARSTVGQASAVTAHGQSHGAKLCLNKIYETDLPHGFDLMGLTASEGIGPEPAITLWSDSALHVFGVSPTESIVRSLASAALFSIDPLSIVLVAWEDENLEVQLFDASSGSIWAMDVAVGNAMKVAEPVELPPASGAMRDAVGWVRAHKVVDVAADTMGIAMVRMDQALPSGYIVDSTLVTRSERSIDRILHIRPWNDDGFLVSEARVPVHKGGVYIHWTGTMENLRGFSSIAQIASGAGSSLRDRYTGDCVG